MINIEKVKWKQRKPKQEHFPFDELQEKLCCIYNIQDLDSWLKPKESDTYDPYILNSIEECARRIIYAIQDGKNIGISYDADSDGFTSGTTMYRFLKNFTDNMIPILPIKREHGIDTQFIPEEVEILIILDSSTNLPETCRLLKECDNIEDILIIDHHIQAIDNPYALIVNNNSKAENYPNKELSAAGMVYKVISVINDMLGYAIDIDNYIDLIGFGVLGDQMSVAEPENRFYIYQSLQRDNIKNSGLKAIIEQSKLNISELSSNDVSYKIVPIINACCRMGEFELLFELLTSDNYDYCLNLAKQALEINEQRKKKIKKMFKKANKNIDNSNSVIYYEFEKENEEEVSFNGLSAMRLVSEYQKPALVYKCKDGICAGSGRGYGNMNFNSICNNTGLFDLVQGHKNSFGVEFKKDNLDLIKKELNKKIKNNQQKIIYYDLEIEHDEIDKDAVKFIEDFNKISGKDAYETKLLIKNIPVREIKIMGKSRDTVKISSDNLDLIKFKTNSDYAKELEIDNYIDAVGTVSVNKFFNWGLRQWIITNQLIIEDYCLSENNR